MSIKNLLLIFTISLGILSCSKSPDTQSTAMSADINGVHWNAPAGYGQYVGPISVMLQGVSNGATISLTMNPYNGATYYAFGGANTAVYKDNAGNTYTATSGSMDISSTSSGKLVGTFSFTASNSTQTIKVTNGNFSIVF